MAYKVVKNRNNVPYLYEQRTYRQGHTVRTQNRYLGKFIDCQEVIRTKDGQSYLCQRTRFESEGKTYSAIDEIRPATADEISSIDHYAPSQPAPSSPPTFEEKIHGKTPHQSPTPKPTPPTPSADSDQHLPLSISTKLDGYNIDEFAMRQETATFTAKLGELGLDTLDMPPVEIRKSRKNEIKTKRRWLFGKRYVLYIPNTNHGRNKIKREFKRSLSRSMLDIIESQHPQVYRELANAFYASYTASKKALSQYVRNTKDRNARAKAITIKRGFYKSAYRNPLSPTQLGRVDNLDYTKWKDEFASVMAEIQSKGLNRLRKMRQQEYGRAIGAKKLVEKEQKKTHWFSWSKNRDLARATKRADARIEANKQMLEKLNIVENCLQSIQRA